MKFSYETSDITSYHLLREFAKKNREEATLAEQQLGSISKESSWEHPLEDNI